MLIFYIKALQDLESFFNFINSFNKNVKNQNFLMLYDLSKDTFSFDDILDNDFLIAGHLSCNSCDILCTSLYTDINVFWTDINMLADTELSTIKEKLKDYLHDRKNLR